MDTWLDILDALYEGSWNPDLERFRSPFAFRGMISDRHTLASSLVRLAGGRADVHRLELALLRGLDGLSRWLARSYLHPGFGCHEPPVGDAARRTAGTKALRTPPGPARTGQAGMNGLDGGTRA